MCNNLPNRKLLRLQKYDYSNAAAYFITICTKDRKTLFSLAEEASEATKMIEKVFNETIESFSGVESPIYVIMPNHFHAIITIPRANKDLSHNLSTIVQAFKSKSTLEYTKMVREGILPPFDKQLWQRSFYDHIIRNNDDYCETYKYIYENPTNWKYDKLYSEDK